jgi:hypothetical protein
MQEVHRKSSSFHDRSATVCPIAFRSVEVDVSETVTSADTVIPDRKKNSLSPQASQLFSITARLNTGNTQKVVVLPRPLSRRMSYRHPVNAQRCHSKNGILGRRKSRPEAVSTITASVTTLLHNRYDKHRYYTESRRLYMTGQVSYVPTTSGKCYTIPLEHQHILTP